MNELLPEEWTDAILELLLVDPTSKQDLGEWTAWLNKLMVVVVDKEES